MDHVIDRAHVIVIEHVTCRRVIGGTGIRDLGADLIIAGKTETLLLLYCVVVALNRAVILYCYSTDLKCPLSIDTGCKAIIV